MNNGVVLVFVFLLINFKLFGHEKVSILDGGLRLWYAHNNNELSTQMPDFDKEVFQIKENKELIRDFDDISRNLTIKEEAVVDVRGPNEFNKLDANGEPNKIPNSLNLPYNDLFDHENGKLKDIQELSRCMFIH